MLARRHSVLFGVLALICGLFIWGWDDVFSDLEHTNAALHSFLGTLEILILGPGMAVMAYAVSENVRASRTALVLERERSRMQRLVALGRVAAGLAHEVRNPLHNIRLLVEETREVHDETQRGDLLGRIDANLTRIDHAVELVYRLARPTGGGSDGSEICDLAQLTSEAVATERLRTAGVPVVQLAACTTAPVSAAADDVRIALDNLLRNASAAAGDDPVQVSLAQECGTWVVYITNRGQLPAAVAALGHGDSFASTKPGGLGLGLAISRQLMVEAGGSLDLSQTGDRVEARLCLPMVTT
jgi:signal transduction histidine kinase